ncbi:NmrA family NAD(P)-binding protein, partial [Enterococcus faecium]
MTTPTILITGATGRTGRFAVEFLRKDGAHVRALAHHDGPKADQLRALGAEVVIGDLLSLNDVT